MVRSSLVFVVLALTSSLAFGCASKEPPAPLAPSTPEPAAAASVAPAPAAAEQRKHKPFDIYSNCTDVVTVVLADEPDSPKAGRRTIAPSAAIEAPREDDGTQWVWLLDGAAKPIAHVHVTRGMKRVEVGKSCRTLDAR